MWLRCVSCKQQNVGSCLRIPSHSLCLFIGELSPLTLRDINDQGLLTPVTFLVIEFVCLPSLSCAGEGSLDV